MDTTTLRSVKFNSQKMPHCKSYPCPDSSDSSFNRSTTCTPSTLKKVNNWINSLNKPNRSDAEGKSRLRKSSSEFYGFDDVDEENMIEDELKRYCNVRRSSSSVSESIGEFVNANSDMKKYTKITKQCKSSDLLEKVTNDTDGDVILSPENEKKKELCSYLQLMKPTDKKAVITLQNRRSVRVKNLSIMQEKRELEKKLREEDENDQKTTNLSMSEEENEIISHKNPEEKQQKWLKYKSVTTFSFPRVHNSLKRTVKNFDQITDENWFKEWTEATKKRTTIRRKSDINPENISEKKKVKTDKNESLKLPDRITRAKGTEISSNMLNGHNNTNKNGFKENSQTENNFSMPKLSPHLSKGIKDFGDIIEENEDLISVNIEAMKSKEIKGNNVKKKNCENVLDKNMQNKKTLTSSKKNLKETNGVVKDKKKQKKKSKLGFKIKTRSFKIKLFSKRKSGSRDKAHKNTAKNFKKYIENLPKTLKHPTNAPFEIKTTNINQKDIDLEIKTEAIKEQIRILKKKKGMLVDSPAKSLPDDDIPIVEPPMFEETFSSQFKGNSTPNRYCSISSSGRKTPEKIRLTKVPDSMISSNSHLRQVESHGSTPPSTIMAIYKKYSPNGISERQDKSEFYSQILNVQKSSDEELEFQPQNSIKSTSVNSTHKTSSIEELSSKFVNKNPAPFISFKKNAPASTLHRCLTKHKLSSSNFEGDNWSSPNRQKNNNKSQYSINIIKEYGPILKIFYIDFNLVLCQENMVSVWTQTALGNVLGAHNMWISKGSIQRLTMNNNCTFKESLEMVVSDDSSLAFIELWIKEHQSNYREGPVADVFAIVYFWKKGSPGLEKKVLQLENINGFADDVQYSVVKSSPKIVVSWHLTSNDMDSKKTCVHCYQLAADFQSLCNINEFEAVDHYVSSLHNIEGCDTLIMGCGENKITLWNIDGGNVAATIEMAEIKSPLATLWVKCDRGFLFTLQQCVDRELRLIAIHGMNHSWKRLASYTPPDAYDRLKGVCVENGIVLAFYDQGIVCWKAQTAEIVLLAAANKETEYISGRYMISVANDEVNVRNIITSLLVTEES